MPVFRVEKSRNYTVMSNHHLKDRNLSLKSKGLLSVILSLPDDWSYTTRGLAAISKEGVDSIGTALKELEIVGYLTRNRLRNEKGQIIDTEYVIYEYPKANPDTTLPDTRPPHTENPYMDIPSMAIPDTEKPTQISINKSLGITNGLNTSTNKTQTYARAPTSSSKTDFVDQLSLENAENNHQSECLTVETAKGTGKPANHTMTIVEKQFESFWHLYPRKAGKKTAKKAWLSINPCETLVATIMAAVSTANQYWSSQNVSMRHIPHPSTWLNEERWDDEFLTNQLPYGQIHGGDNSATIGANYTIGGDDDPYKVITS